MSESEKHTNNTPRQAEVNLQPQNKDRRPSGAEAEVLVRVENVSKKFCKDLKTSLKYGAQDIVGQVFGKEQKKELRPKEFWAVKDVSFELRRGECLGLIGHNGAGKSTLLKMLNGLINPDEGKIEMHGRVAALIELGAGFNPILSGRENIYNNGSVLGLSRKEIDDTIEEIIDFSEIREFIDTPVQNYSSGMKVRLGFAVATSFKPDVLILDEVLAVGDAGFKIKSMNKIAKIMQNAAVIFVSHSMQQVSKVCSHALYMHKGNADILSTNVGIVIEKYFENFKTEDAFVEYDLGAEIISLMLNNKYANDEITVNYDEKLTLSLEINVKDKKSEKFHINVQVIDKDLKIVEQFFSNKFHPEFESQENTEVKMEFDNVRLVDGEYTISLLLIDDTENIVVDNRTLAVYRNFIKFKMKGLGDTLYSSHYLKGAIFQNKKILSR